LPQAHPTVDRQLDALAHVIARDDIKAGVAKWAISRNGVYQLERPGAVNRGERFSHLKSHDGGGRMQRALDPATIYAQYAKRTARRRWGIIIIAGLSTLSWTVVILLVIAALSAV
jgi:hypothetical protein